MRSELTPQELSRMSVAQLAEYGRQALQAGLYDRAATLFREAVRRAPMRQDFKDCLGMAIEGSLFDNPHTRSQSRPTPETRRPASAPEPREPYEPRPPRDPRERDPRDLPERRDSAERRPPSERQAPPERRPRPARPAEPQAEPYFEPRRPEPRGEDRFRTPAPRPEPEPEPRLEPRFEERSEPVRPEPRRPSRPEPSRPEPPPADPAPPAAWLDPLDALPAEEDDASDLAGPAAPYPPPRPAPRPEARRDTRPEYADPAPRPASRPEPPPAPRPRPSREAERQGNGRAPGRPQELHPPRGADPYPPRPARPRPEPPRPEPPRRPAVPQGPAAHYRPGDFNRRHQRGPVMAYFFGALAGFLMCGAIAAGGWFYLQYNPKVLAGLHKDSNGADLQLAVARARTFSGKGEYSRAIDVLMEQPESPDRNKILAGMFNDQGDNQITHQSPPRFEAAVEAFKSAIKYDPNNMHYRSNLADAYYQLAVSQENADHKVAQNFLDLARQSCENVLDQDSKNLEALTILKRVALKKRDDALLAKTYKRIIEAAPGSPEAAEARKNLDELKLR